MSSGAGEFRVDRDRMIVAVSATKKNFVTQPPMSASPGAMEANPGAVATIAAPFRFRYGHQPLARQGQRVRAVGT
jgi:hypothetical protein